MDNRSHYFLAWSTPLQKASNTVNISPTTGVAEVQKLCCISLTLGKYHWDNLKEKWKGNEDPRMRYSFSYLSSLDANLKEHKTSSLILKLQNCCIKAGGAAIICQRDMEIPMDTVILDLIALNQRYLRIVTDEFIQKEEWSDQSVYPYNPQFTLPLFIELPAPPMNFEEHDQISVVKIWSPLGLGSAIMLISKERWRILSAAMKRFSRKMAPELLTHITDSSSVVKSVDKVPEFRIIQQEDNLTVQDYINAFGTLQEPINMPNRSTTNDFDPTEDSEYIFSYSRNLDQTLNTNRESEKPTIEHLRYEFRSIDVSAIIGQKGAMIEKIRKESNCVVKILPHDSNTQTDDSAVKKQWILFTGPRKNCMIALKLMYEIICYKRSGS